MWYLDEKKTAMLMKWVWLFLSFIGTTTGTFSVVVPSDPVSGRFGSSVFLPCVISPSLSAEHLEVRWYRPKMYDTPVFHYKDQQILESSVDPQYRGRVSLIGGLDKGNVSLKLENLTLTDGGDYTCHVISGSWYDRAKISVRMMAVGSVPVLSVTEGDEQVNITCVSHGWFPQPTVTWRDREGRDMKHINKDKFISDSEGLVSVSSWLLFSLSQSESEWISCSVGLSEWDTRESRILPHKSQSQMNGCTEAWTAFIITAVLLLIIATLAVYVLLHQRGTVRGNQRGRVKSKGQNNEDIENQHPTKMEEYRSFLEDNNTIDASVKPQTMLAEPDHSSQPTDMENQKEILEENNTTSKVSVSATEATPVPVPLGISSVSPVPEGSHVSVLESAPARVPTPEAKTGTELNTHPVNNDEKDERQTPHPPHISIKTPELNQVQKYKVDITIDAKQTPQGLRFTHMGKRVNYHSKKGNPTEDDQKLFAVCKEKFSTGKHYWEVKVWGKPKEKLSWYVGVTRDREKHHYNVPLTPQNEFWVLCYEEEHGVYFGDVKDQLKVFSDKCTIIGVFLDCDEHTLSFYDVETQSHLHTIENIQSNTSLVPLISPGIRDNKPIKIHVTQVPYPPIRM